MEAPAYTQVVQVAGAPSAGPDRIRVKNRRKRYLDLHPDYFGSQLELAGVLDVGIN